MKKVYFSFLLALIFCLAFVPGANAQYKGHKKKYENRFGAGAVIGTNLSQIDGDLYTGFNKIGLRVGMEGSIYMNKRLDVVIGLLYVQKGSKTNSEVTFASDVPPDTEIKLDYMEVPFLLSIKFGNKTQHSYTLEAGFSYARLINSTFTFRDFPDKVDYSQLADQLNSNEFSAVMGINFMFTKRFDIGFLFEVQLNKLYQLPEDQVIEAANASPPQVTFMRNYLIGIQAGYKFL
jgi:hypothetical protein